MRALTRRDQDPDEALFAVVEALAKAQAQADHAREIAARVATGKAKT
jgi:hypothetical protein